MTLASNDIQNIFRIEIGYYFHTLLPLTLYHPKSTIITISNHSKQEIAHFYPKVADKIYVTLLAADNTFLPIRNNALLQNVKERFGIKSDFILAVGNLQPRKNLARLIKAFAAVQDHIGDINLVIVGKAQWQASEIYRIVEELQIEDKVVFTGYVSDEDLVLLYNAAQRLCLSIDL